MEPNAPEDPAMAKALARYSVIASVVSRKWPTAGGQDGRNETCSHVHP